jgi:hypothetical protein
MKPSLDRYTARRGLLWPATPREASLGLETAEAMDFTLKNARLRLERTANRWQDAMVKKYSFSQVLGRESDK